MRPESHNGGGALALNAVERMGPAWGKLILIAIVIAGLTAAWRYTPLAQFVSPERVIHWAHSIGEARWAPLVVMRRIPPPGS